MEAAYINHEAFILIYDTLEPQLTVLSLKHNTALQLWDKSFALNLSVQKIHFKIVFKKRSMFFPKAITLVENILNASVIYRYRVS